MGNRIPIREDTFVESPEGVLLANRCNSCGQIFFPKAIFCLNCLSEDMSELRLSRIGKLYSYTVGHMPSTHFEPPYAIGYVDMPEGVRIFAPLKMTKDKPFTIGMEMEVVVETLWREGDKEVVGYEFRPVKDFKS